MPQDQQQMYDRAYDAYLNNRNAEVHDAYSEMMRKYPVSDVMPKFMFLHALAYVTEKKPDEFNSTLRELLERYPDTDITPLASAYLKGMAQGRKLNEGVSNTRGMLWDIRLTNEADSTASASADNEDAFVFDADVPQVLVLAFPTDSVSPNELLYMVARHNFNSFVVKDFDLEQMNFGRLGMLLVKGFENEAEAEHYRTLLGRSTHMTLPPQVTPFIMTADNFNRLIAGGHTLEDYFRAAGENSLDRTEDANIPEPPEVETSEEEPAKN